MDIKTEGATTGAMVKILSERAKTRPRNARYLAQILRDAGVLRGEGTVGVGVKLTTTEAASWLIGQTLSPSLPKAAETISFYRDLPFCDATLLGGKLREFTAEQRARDVLFFLRGLTFGASLSKGFGFALDALLNDMRSGAYDRWTENVEVRISLEFHDVGLAHIVIDRWQFERAAVLGYGDRHAADKNDVSRVTRIRGDMLKDIAAALGPPE